MRKHRLRETEKKRKKYAENIAMGMNKTKAALDAGFSIAMAHNAAASIETPEVIATIKSLEESLLESIPTELLVQKLKEGLDANIVKTTQVAGKKKVSQFPDHPTRLRYVEKIALISGRYRPKTTTEHTGKDGGPIELTALDQDKIDQRIQWLERELGFSHPSGLSGGALPLPPGEDEAD